MTQIVKLKFHKVADDPHFDEFQRGLAQWNLCLEASSQVSCALHWDQQGPFLPGEKGVGVRLNWMRQWDVHVRKNYSLAREPLAKALGLKRSVPSLVVDLTAGTGKDAVLICSFGAKVVAFERNATVFTLLAYEYQKLLRQRPEHPLIERLSLNWGEFNAELAIDQVSAFYFDPMYEQLKKKRTAKPRKEMVAFENLIGADEDQMKFAQLMMQLSPRKLIIKRPLKAPVLLEKRNVCFEGKTTRYDLYCS